MILAKLPLLSTHPLRCREAEDILRSASVQRLGNRIEVTLLGLDLKDRSATPNAFWGQRLTRWIDSKYVLEAREETIRRHVGMAGGLKADVIVDLHLDRGNLPKGCEFELCLFRVCEHAEEASDSIGHLFVSQP